MNEEIGKLQDGFFEAALYLQRLERYALDNDGYRCDACRLVFDVDEGEHGEDCWLCNECAAQAREGTAP